MAPDPAWNDLGPRAFGSLTECLRRSANWTELEPIFHRLGNCRGSGLVEHAHDDGGDARVFQYSHPYVTSRRSAVAEHSCDIVPLEIRIG